MFYVPNTQLCTYLINLFYLISLGGRGVTKRCLGPLNNTGASCFVFLNVLCYIKKKCFVLGFFSSAEKPNNCFVDLVLKVTSSELAV